MRWDEGSRLSGGLPGKLSIAGIALGVLALGTCGTYGACFTYVEPNETAIKESKYFGGIKEGVYKGGNVYFSGPGVRYNIFPKDWQVLDFNDYQFEKTLEENISGYDQEPQLEIPSSDGFLNRFDLSIIYRITDPDIVIDTDRGVGKGDLFKDFVKTKADPALKKGLGAMAAEEIYNVDTRLRHASSTRAEREKSITELLTQYQAAKGAFEEKPSEENKLALDVFTGNILVENEQARKKYVEEKSSLELLNEALNPVGIEVGEVLVRQFHYMKKYEAKISSKVLQRQLEIANRELAKAATVEADVKKIIAEGQAGVKVETERADKEKRILESEARRYQREKEAAGNLLMKNAEAEGQRLVNKAVEGVGSERIVGIEMAKKTGQAVKKIYIKSCRGSGANPLDLGDLTRKFTGR